MTKIIKNAASVVLYAGDALVLTAQHATNGDWIDPSTTTSNAVLVDSVQLPSDWVGGYYAHAAGLWTRTPDGQAAHDAATLAAKAAKWEAIKSKRDSLSDNGGYLVSGKWFHSDEKSKTQQLGLFIMGASVPPVQWKTMDGSFVTMTQTLAAGIFQAAASQDMAIFAAAETHKAAMEASADPAAYDFSGGWPATFPG